MKSLNLEKRQLKRYVILVSMFLANVVTIVEGKRKKRGKKKKYTNAGQYFRNIAFIFIICLLPVLVAFCWEWLVKDRVAARVFKHYKKKFWKNINSSIIGRKNRKSSKARSRRSKVKFAE